MDGVFLACLLTVFYCVISSLHTLAEMFELPPGVVHSIISKMIINEELQVNK